MRTALSERPVKGTSACVCEVDEEKETLQVKKIDGFGKLYNIQFEEKGIRVWKAYGIVRGNEISFEQLVSQSQRSTGLKIVNNFLLQKIHEHTNARNRCQTVQMTTAIRSWTYLSVRIHGGEEFPNLFRSRITFGHRRPFCKG